ncbi:MAG: ABC transporter ATP-binding protein [Saprospiraceae bacterium]|nr:ABC transporter ATP-binding protein [Saprospiraceae bacterium]
MQNPYISLLRTAWKYAHHERKRYLLVYAMFAMSNIFIALEPILWGIFINQLQQEGAEVLRSAWWYAAAFMLIRLLDWSFHGNARVMERLLAFNMSRNFLEEIYQKTVHLPVKWHQDNHSGATISRVRKAYEALKTFFEGGFRYIQAIANFIFAFAAILYFSPLFGGIALLIGVGIIYLITLFDKPFVKALHETNEREHKVSSNLFDSLSNILTVITLRLERRMEQGLMAKVMQIFPPFKTQVVINEWKWFVVDMLVGLIYVVTIVGFVYQNYQPSELFLIGGLVTLAGYLWKFTSVFIDFAWQYTEIVQYHTDVKAAQTIIDAYEQMHREEDEETLPRDWQSIRIENINFVHDEAWALEGKRLQGLKNLSIQITRGKRVALIGESGSGKSTLLALLRGLYPAGEGIQAIIDEQQVFTHLKAINSRVTLFPQEPEIFENTIEYNISMGLPHEPEEMTAALETAHFADVVAQLPNGLLSNIQEKGVNLSGGQKQRLALARGVFVAKFSDIVLLDEPTSSVDPKTELEIYDKMFAQFHDKAVVSALHRLHLLPKFDCIYILKDGEVVESGTFEELRWNSSVFQELWRHQEEVTNTHLQLT